MIESLFRVDVEGVGEEVESLRSFMFAITAANAIKPRQLEKYIGPLTVTFGPLSGRPISIGMLGPDINGHSEKTELILDRLSHLGFQGLERTTFIAFKLIGARSTPAFLRSERAWCSSCLQSAIDACRRPYDKLLWAVSFIDRCPFHEQALVDRCPSCNSAQKSYSRVDSTTCIYCNASLIYAEDRREMRRTPTKGEADLIAILRIADARTQFRYNLDNIFKFVRAYQASLAAADVEKFRQWHLDRRVKHWARIKRQVHIVSLFAYAHLVGVPIRLLLEHPEEAVLHLRAKGSSQFTSLGHQWPLVLDGQCGNDNESEVMQENSARRVKYLRSWDESLWIPEYAFAAKYLSEPIS